jgi:ABC-2 type transport system permease protein
VLIKFVNRLFEGRFWALAIKEVNQILRNKELISLLIFPPTLQLVIFGLALNPNVEHIKLGIVDYSNTPASRELVSAFTENQVLVLSVTVPVWHPQPAGAGRKGYGWAGNPALF